MPVRSALESSGKFLRHAADTATPRLKRRKSAPTRRDYTTSGLGAALAVIMVAALHHGAKIDLSPEVVAALTTVSGFMTARYFRY